MRTATHFLGCTHELGESRELVQLAPMTSQDKPVENGVIVLVDRPPEPFAMTRHLDHLVRLLRVVDVPTVDKLRDAVQIGKTRGGVICCTVKHLVDSRFGQACARTPGILQNEGLGSALARLLPIDLKLNLPHERPTANKASRLPEW